MQINLEGSAHATIAKEEGLLEVDEGDIATTLDQYVKFVAKLVTLLLTVLQV